MNRGHKIAVAVSLAVVVLCLAGSFMTRGVMEHLSFLHGEKSGWNAAPRSYGIVDQRPWQTAKTLAALAVSAEELELAREAERLADHEVDQAFAQSLRQASAETRELTGEALTLQHRVTELQQTVKDDQQRVAALTPKAGSGCRGGCRFSRCSYADRGRPGCWQGAAGPRPGRIGRFDGGSGAGERRSSRKNPAGIVGARSGDEEIRRAGDRRRRWTDRCDLGRPVQDPGGADL